MVLLWTDESRTDPLWDGIAHTGMPNQGMQLLIPARQLSRVTPLLEVVLSRVTGNKLQPARQADTQILPVIQPETTI